MIGLKDLTTNIRCFYIQLYIIIIKALFSHFFYFIESVLTIFSLVCTGLWHSSHPVKFRAIKIIGTFNLCIRSLNTFLPLLQIIAVVSFILIHLTIVYFYNFGADPIQKITVMRYHQQTKVGTAQILFEPFRHIEIKVIGRLIQNQQIRLSD